MTKITWPLVGDRFKNNSGDWYTVIEINGCNNIKIRFDDGFEKVVAKGNIKSGSIRLPKVREGQTYKDKLGNTVLLLKLEKGGFCTFQWEDGYERRCQSSVISLNTIMREEDSKLLNPTFKVGYKGVLKGLYKYEVVRVENSSKVTILIHEPVPHEVTVNSGNLIRGTVTNRYVPSVAGVGILGIESVDVRSKVYRTWSGMLKRVYTPISDNEIINYGDTCSVHPDWHYFPNFKKWFDTQILKDDWHLDKDLLVKGNKQYSPDKCVLLPKEVNWFLTSRKNHRGLWPIGVTYHDRINKWQATCSTNNNGDGYIGVYNSPEDAFYAYKKVKEQYAKDLAEKWKGIIDDKAIVALLRYEVSITD